MTTVALKKWDVVEHIQTEEDMQLYLDACMEEGDPSLSKLA
jgi:DNA-binding phage protein